jgi:hypothetical protein
MKYDIAALFAIVCVAAVAGTAPRPGSGRAAADDTPVLPSHRIVGFYGNPLSARMGILGALPADSMVRRLEAQAQAWALADTTTPVVPALHLVTVVAHPHACPDGKYRTRAPDSLIERMSSLAQRKGWLLFLDVQPGRSTVAAEVAGLRKFLVRPWVHLALDPEFAMAGDQVPGRVIGSLDAADINGAVDTLAAIARDHGLAPRILVVHRFTQRMVMNADRIRIDPQVQIVMDMDGFGRPALKRDSYRQFIAAEPVQYTGFKLFYQQDVPLMSPADVLRLQPRPVFILYQ